MANTAVINPRRFQLLRTRISRTENLVSGAVLLGLIASIAWVWSTHGDFDPAFRDIAPELLAKSDAEKTLFVPPLKRLSQQSDLASAASGARVPSLEPFSPAILNDGWSLASRIRKFSATTLFEKINGEAPKFIKQGFQSMHYVVVRSAETDEEIGIELFDQGDRGGSLGIFSDHQSRTAKLESANGVDFFRTSIGAIGRRGRFFFRIIGDNDSQSVRDKSMSIVSALASLPGEEADAPPGMSLLTEKLGADSASVSFQKANVFKFDYARDFWFARRKGDTRIFAHESTSPDDARALFRKLVDDQGFDFETVQTDVSRAVLLHGFLKNYFALGVSNNWVYGVENAESVDAATAELEQFETQLGEDQD